VHEEVELVRLLLGHERSLVAVDDVPRARI
jgi:hypothetical protein